MQNTMLDSTISSNSQELFDFNAVHNGEHCIASLDPKDERENRFWFTVAMLVAIYNESDKTIRNNIEELAQEGELGDCKIFQRRINIEDSCGVPHPTTIYNLEVLNRLGMCCFRKNRKAKEIRDKFNDVLVERETGVKQNQPQFAVPKTLPEALRLYAAEIEAKEKALQERDEAIRTKAMIGSNREATAMATASAKSRECKRLTAENAELKDAVGRGTNWCTVSVMKSEWKREFGHEPVWQKLMKFSEGLPTEMQPVKDVDEKVVLRNGSEKWNKVYRYHREAWAKYREYEENSRVTDKNAPNTKILGLSVTDTEVEYF